MKNSISRKQFLQRCALMGAALFGGGAFLAGCGGGDKGDSGGQAGSSAADDPCGDTTGLTNSDLQMRKNLKYVVVSTEEGKNCANCKFYLPDQFGEHCGGCQLFKGPVHPEGNCSSWFAMDQG